jgi:hypothetical protein
MERINLGAIRTRGGDVDLSLQTCDDCFLDGARIDNAHADTVRKFPQIGQDAVDADARDRGFTNVGKCSNGHDCDCYLHTR